MVRVAVPDRRRAARLGLLVVLAVLAGSPAVAHAASPSSLSATGSLNVARASQTSTRLFGGRVLVAGGQGAGGMLASAELFNPNNGAWTPTGSMGTARALHTATLISDRPNACLSNCGKVLVAGGLGPSGQPLASAELYDPATGSWTVTGALKTPRASHTATLLSNGKILVVGGSGPDGQPLASAEIFNPGTGSWTATASLATARSSHTATLLKNGKVLVVGGVGSNGQPLSSAEVYDPSGNAGAGSWTPTASLADARSAHTASALGDEISGTSDPRVLVVGGVGAGGSRLASAEMYNAGNGTWTRADPLANARAFHTAGVLSDGSVVVAGGSGPGGQALASVELFRPASGRWTPIGSLATPRSAHRATVLLDGRLLMAGGNGPGGVRLASAELYRPSLTDDHWAPTASMRTARSAHTATLLPNGEVLVAGGQTSFDNFRTVGPGCCNIAPLASAELYHPASGTWTETGSLGRARSFDTATLLQGSPAQCASNCGKVLVAGGFGAVEPPGPTGNAVALASAELYDPATGRWTTTGSMSGARGWHTATMLENGKVLVAGGSSSPVAGNAIDTAEIYDPVTGTWTPTGSLKVGGLPNKTGPQGAREVPAAALLSGSPAQCGNNCGKVLVVGGTGGFGSGPSFSSAELYDPATGTFRRTADLAESRQPYENATRLLNGSVLVGGGFHSPFTDFPPHLDNAEVYDPVTETWRVTGLLRDRRLYQSQTLLPGGELLAAGGVAGGNAPGFPYKPGPGLLSSEVYNPAGNGWGTTTFMSTGRLLHTATLLPSGPPSVCGENCGKVLVAGGDRELIGNFVPSARYVNPLSSAELYTPGGAVAPVVSGYRLTNNPFVVSRRRTPAFGRAARARKHKKATTFRYVLSEAAPVRIVITQRLVGRRKGKRCLAPTRNLHHARRCARVIRKGTLTRTSHRGANRFAFSGRIGSRALKPGRYQATLTATASPKTSRPRTITFTIVIR